MSRSLRALAPVAKPADDSAMAPLDPYAASCNPPRRAKRPRSDITVDELDQVHSNTVKSQPSSDSAKGDESLPAPPRRGRKPGTLSRAAREAQRKINHSLIEKARRTKINDALATLKILVPSDAADEDAPGSACKTKNKKEEKEKEFKLEVLVRTVAYVEELTAKIKMLEDRGCSHCGKHPLEPPATAGTKRKRECEEECDALPAPGNRDPVSWGSPSKSLSPPVVTPRLPSISSWLGHPVNDLGRILRSPTQLPVVYTPGHRSSTSQLPSPPLSGIILAEPANQIPPILSLPSPNLLGTSRLSSSVSVPHACTSCAPASPTFSPVHTPEDESAATLLLQISSSSPTSSSIYGEDKSWKEKDVTVKAQTPGSLLGLTRS